MKIKRPKWHCKGCVWITRENLCPFVNCVRWNGFTVDQRGRGNEKGRDRENLKKLSLDGQQH